MSYYWCLYLDPNHGDPGHDHTTSMHMVAALRQQVLKKSYWRIDLLDDEETPMYKAQQDTWVFHDSSVLLASSNIPYSKYQ